MWPQGLKNTNDRIQVRSTRGICLCSKQPPLTWRYRSPSSAHMGGVSHISRSSTKIAQVERMKTKGLTALSHLHKKSRDGNESIDWLCPNTTCIHILHTYDTPLRSLLHSRQHARSNYCRERCGRCANHGWVGIRRPENVSRERVY